jgi:hypothetical protein
MLTKNQMINYLVDCKGYDAQELTDEWAGMTTKDIWDIYFCDETEQERAFEYTR